MDPKRKIIHSDLDSFYPQVEQRDNPALRGRPVIVGGDPDGRGVVASASYEARRFGVHSAQSCQVAKKLCPEAIFLRPRFAVYREISAQIFAIYRRHTHLVEPLALDEAFIDLSSVAVEPGSAVRIAKEIKQAIWEQTQLTTSVGVSHNKYLAKLASSTNKPNGLTVITMKNVQSVLETLPIGKIFGVGEATEARLKGEFGINVGRELQQVPLEKLVSLFGKRGQMLYQFCHGEDDRRVDPARVRKSIGKEQTFRSDLEDREEMLDLLVQLAEQVIQRSNELGMTGKTVTLKLRWSDFTDVSRAGGSVRPIQNAEEIMHIISPLLDQLLQEKKSVRLLGVTLSNLISPTPPSTGNAMATLWDGLS